MGATLSERRRWASLGEALAGDDTAPGAAEAAQPVTPAAAEAAAAAGEGVRLRFDRVSVEYATAQRAGATGVRAVEQVSLQVHAAERYVLLGPSGCGKSTLLKVAAGLLPAAAGRIELDGQAVRGPGPDRMVVFQEFDQLPPWKTVLANVVFPLRVARKLPQREAREQAMHTLHKVGLAEFADAYPHQLSGGMKQRVAIARALAMQPRVLLMDEPFAALDALTRRRMQQELLALWEDIRFTLLFVTHSIEEALLVGTRIGVLTPRPGRLRAEVNAHEFGFHSEGGAAFQAAHRRVHHWLFPAPGDQFAGSPG